MFSCISYIHSQIFFCLSSSIIPSLIHYLSACICTLHTNVFCTFKTFNNLLSLVDFAYYNDGVMIFKYMPLVSPPNTCFGEPRPWNLEREKDMKHHIKIQSYRYTIPEWMIESQQHYKGPKVNWDMKVNKKYHDFQNKVCKWAEVRNRAGFMWSIQQKAFQETLIIWETKPNVNLWKKKLKELRNAVDEIKLWQLKFMNSEKVLQFKLISKD